MVSKAIETRKEDFLKVVPILLSLTAGWLENSSRGHHVDFLFTFTCSESANLKLSRRYFKTLSINYVPLNLAAICE
jgi:hypothetical protein